ncbi:hypothetical protein JXB28_00885 [Candidatus Woesearchaeota archaeon]|nr:hypothetical protein [Candidatus Woesearchaeota archaeon]
MCFSPQISLLTAVVEFILAALIIARFRKSAVARFAAIFIFLLGFYQLTEFMLCTTGDIDAWARMGFITYTFLPALGLHLVFKLSDKMPKAFVFYIPAIIFAGLAAFSKGFVVGGACHSVFISVHLMFLNPSANSILYLIYGAYYAGFIFLGCFLAGLMLRKEKDEKKRKKMIVGLAAVLLATVPALLFVIIMPALGNQFPSIYCEFALLMAIAGYCISYLDHNEK